MIAVFRRTWTLALAGILVLGALGPVLAAPEVPMMGSEQSDRTRVDVTVYNRNLALVREIRSVDLPQGEFVLEFRDVPAQIQPATLLVEGGGRSGLELYEQNYEFDLMSPEKVLQKYVGRQVQWIQEDGSRLSGTLLGLNQKPIFEIDGEILFEVPGRIVLPELPQNLRARPTLVWRAHAERAGRTDVEASYLTGGMSWHADYVLQLDRDGKEAGLQAWVTVENRSGSGFPEANLLLVAGDINVVAPQRDMMMAMNMEAGAARAPSFSEETLYDYHLYTLDRPTELRDQQIKQISLYEAAGVKVAKKYSLRARPHFFRGIGPLHEDGKVDVSYSFANTTGNSLGMPMPAGVVRVYGVSGSGARQLLGEDRIDHTPRDETISLTVGKAFDVVAERIRVESRRIADNLHRAVYRITLRNHREEPISVEVNEPVGGDWEVLKSTHPARRVSSSELAFDVPVPAGGQSVLEYTVEIRY